MGILTRFKHAVKAWRGVNPTSEGLIPLTWPWNYWQRDMRPLSTYEVAAAAACRMAYSHTIATLPVVHDKLNDQGGRDHITGSTAARIFWAPNDYQTSSDFSLQLVDNLFYTGNAYVYGIRNDRGEFSNTHIMPSLSTSPYIEPESKAIFYGFGSNPLVDAVDVLVPARDVCHIRLHTPHHPLVGVPPIENAALAMASNNAISGHQAAFFSNMNRPSGILTTDQVLTKEQNAELRYVWEQRAKGLNTGEVPILSSGLKWQPMSINSVDSQLIQAFKMTVEEIARVYRVPLPLIGEYEHSTYNNVEQLLQSWLSTGLGFLIEHLEASWIRFFRLQPGNRIQYQTDALLRSDFRGRVEALTRGITQGLYSPNEARVREGLPRVEYGEEPRVQAQVVPLSQVNAAPSVSAPAAPAAELDPEKEYYIAREEILRAMT